MPVSRVLALSEIAHGRAGLASHVLGQKARPQASSPTTCKPPSNSIRARDLAGICVRDLGHPQGPSREGSCSGELISGTKIGLFAAMFRSKTAGGRLPKTEFKRSRL